MALREGCHTAICALRVALSLEADSGEGLPVPPLSPPRLPGWPDVAVPLSARAFQVLGNISRKAILIHSASLVGRHPGHHSAHFALCSSDRFLFIFPWTCALISLSLTHFTAMPLNDSASRVLDGKRRSWGIIFKSRRHGAACPQTCSSRSPVQHRRPAVRGALPTHNGGFSWPSCPSQMTYWERVIRESAFLEILLWEWASVLHCMCVQVSMWLLFPCTAAASGWGCSEITGGFEAACEKHFSRSSCFSWIALATSTGNLTRKGTWKWVCAEIAVIVSLAGSRRATVHT